MQYQYHTVDVFTDVRFGGNQLAVFPKATGLSQEQMQLIAREFNYSETTFVFPPSNSANDANLRIFTPEREIPFAGHPNIGTAHVLQMIRGISHTTDGETVLRFEELAGVVSVSVRSRAGVPVHCELTAPQPLELGPELDSESDLNELAQTVSLLPEDILTNSHYPRHASVGLPFLCVEVRNVATLTRVQLRAENWARFVQRGDCSAIHLYTRDTGLKEIDLMCRMFVCMPNVREDPATGSANCALAGLLASLAKEVDGSFTYRIAQGIDMGRPSELFATVEKRANAVTAVRIGGASVSVASGSIDID